MSVDDRPAPRAAFETHSERVGVLHCRGELDLATSAELGAVLDGAVAQRPAALVVDLAAVTFFDCSAIGHFVRARTAARMQGTDLLLRSPSPFGQHVLRAVGLADMVVPVAEPRDRADDATGHQPPSADRAPASWDEACEGAYRVVRDEFVLVLPEPGPEGVHDVMGRVVVEDSGAFAWGCAWVQGEDEAPVGADVAAQLLHVTRARMLAYRARTRTSERSASDSGQNAQRAGPVPSSTAEVADQLVSGNRDLVVVERARGVIAEQLEIDLDAATTALHAYAHAHGRAVPAVAAALIDHTLEADQLATVRSDTDATPAGRATSRPAAAPESGA